MRINFRTVLELGFEVASVKRISMTKFCFSEMGMAVFVVCLRMQAENLLARRVFLASCNSKLDK